jgi:hypothetical protein
VWLPGGTPQRPAVGLTFYENEICPTKITK